MKKYNPDIHQRRSIRLKGFDYSREGLYFITICCQNKEHYFGEIIDGEMILNEIGRIAYDEWINTEKIRENVVLHSFVVMPNHFHAILEIAHQCRGVLHTPNNSKINGDNIKKDVCNTSDDNKTNGDNIKKGVCNTSNDNKIDDDDMKKGVCNTSDDNKIDDDDMKKGVCNTSDDNKKNGDNMKKDILHTPNNNKINNDDMKKGVCNTPLQSPSQTLGAIVRGYKSAVSKKTGFSIWQRNYYEHIIRNEESYFKIHEYIENNPTKWEEDCFYS